MAAAIETLQADFCEEVFKSQNYSDLFFGIPNPSRLALIALRVEHFDGNPNRLRIVNLIVENILDRAFNPSRRLRADDINPTNEIFEILAELAKKHDLSAFKAVLEKTLAPPSTLAAEAVLFNPATQNYQSRNILQLVLESRKKNPKAATEMLIFLMATCPQLLTIAENTIFGRHSPLDIAIASHDEETLDFLREGVGQNFNYTMLQNITTNPNPQNLQLLDYCLSSPAGSQSMTRILGEHPELVSLEFLKILNAHENCRRFDTTILNEGLSGELLNAIILGEEYDLLNQYLPRLAVIIAQDREANPLFIALGKGRAETFYTLVERYPQLCRSLDKEGLNRALGLPCI